MDWDDEKTTSLAVIRQRCEELERMFESLQRAGEVGYLIYGEIANSIELVLLSAIKKLARFDKELAAKVDLLATDKVDLNYVRSESFGRDFLGILSAVRMEQEDQKIKYFAQILANWITVDYTENDRRAGQ